MADLHVRVSDDIKAAWTALARRSGLGASELLRQTIATVLAGNAAAETEPQGGDDEASDPHDDVRLRLQLRRHEVAAIDEAARPLGWRRNTWIASLVRAHLFREPRTTDRELAALHRSTSELLAIGRNLNQIARALHRDDRYKDSVTLQRIEELRQAIAMHVDDVQAVLDAAENRWPPPERSFRPETSRGSQ